MLAPLCKQMDTEQAMADRIKGIDDAARSPGQGEPVRFADRLVGSNAFHALFEQGMQLVEETAAYLDGDGREASKLLPRIGAMAYATESMRLTTRLMQLASWLLLQRAVHEGEMTLEQAAQEKAKVRIHGLSSPNRGPGWDDLPERLRQLVEASVELQDRVQRLDSIFYKGRAASVLVEPSDNPVAAQMARLSDAFAKG
jgi:regulator of CtrA degradation